MIHYSYLKNFIYLLNKVKCNLNELNDNIKEGKMKCIIFKCSNLVTNISNRINKMIEEDNYSYLILFEINKNFISLQSYLIEVYNENINLNINKIIRTCLIDIDICINTINKLQ